MGFLVLNAHVMGLSLSDFGNPLTDIPRYQKWKTDMEGKIHSTFALMVPENERSKWKMLNGKATIGNTNDYAKGSWMPYADASTYWSELVVCYFECLPKEKETRQPEFQSIREYMKHYKRDVEKNDQFKFEVKMMNINETDAIIEMDRYDIGTSGLIKKGSVLKIVERWILSGNWLIGLKYELDPSRNAEKGAAWDQLKETWVKRFYQVHFGN